MFCVVSFIAYPESSDPIPQEAVLFEHQDEAIAYANDLLAETEDEYGEDLSEEASEDGEMALYSNGDVTWRAYVLPIDMG